MDWLQQTLPTTDLDGTLYFYATDDLGQVNGLPPTDPGYEAAVRDHFIGEGACSDLLTQPLARIPVPDVPNYGVALTLDTDPANLYTVQDLLTLALATLNLAVPLAKGLVAEKVSPLFPRQGNDGYFFMENTEFHPVSMGCVFLLVAC